MMRLMEQCVQNTSGMSVVMEGSGSEAGSGSTGPAGLVVGSKANYDDHKLGSRGRVDSSMSQHSDEGDSAKYRDRKASIQTNDSTVTNGAHSATYMGEEETPPGTSRSRRSSIGSVEATPQSILRKSSITSGTAPACANNATDSPSGKKRHSFSDPIATEFIFDKDGSVSTPPPANRAVTAAKQLAVLVAAHEKGQEIERATDASHGSRGTTSPGSEEDDSLPSKEDEGTGAGTGAGAGQEQLGHILATPMRRVALLYAVALDEEKHPVRRSSTTSRYLTLSMIHSTSPLAPRLSTPSVSSRPIQTSMKPQACA